MKTTTTQTATYSVQLIKNNGDMAAVGFGSHLRNDDSVTREQAWGWIQEQTAKEGYDKVVVYNRGNKCAIGYKLANGSYAWSKSPV